MAKISPQNNEYVVHTFEKIFKGKVDKKVVTTTIPVELRPDSVLNTEEKKYKEAKQYLLNAQTKTHTSAVAQTVSFIPRPSLPKDNIHSAPFQHKQDSSAARLQVIHYAMEIGRDTSIKRINTQPLPGKLLAVKQTVNYLQRHPGKIITGAGIGNFSSKLAFRATGLQVAGGYPSKYIYVNEDFRQNQLAIFLDYFGKDSGFHSITNSPNNVYLQMLAEYGLAGFIALFALYGWFFMKRTKGFGFATPLLILAGCIFFVEYWFEQLSVIVLFELLMFVLQKQKTEGRVHEQ